MSFNYPGSHPLVLSELILGCMPVKLILSTPVWVGRIDTFVRQF